MKITVEKCCCGHTGCRDYWLVGIGKVVQGSGFTKSEAERIADLLNGDETARLLLREALPFLNFLASEAPDPLPAQNLVRRIEEALAQQG